MARSSPSCACWEVGHTERDFCDGQSLASAGGLWRIGVVLQTAAGVQSSTSSTSRRIAARRSFSRGSLSVTLEARRSCRVVGDSSVTPRIARTVQSTTGVSSCHNGSHETLQWRSDVPAGSGIWMPRLPAHYRPQRWRLAEHGDPLEYVESRRHSGATWRNKCSSVAELSNKVVAALDEQLEGRSSSRLSSRRRFVSQISCPHHVGGCPKR